MKGKGKSRGAIVDRFLKTLDRPSVSADRLRESQERLRHLVESEWEEHAEERKAALLLPNGSDASRIAFRRKVWIAIPATVVVLLLVLVFVRPFTPKTEIARTGSTVIARTAEGAPISQGTPFRTTAHEGTSIVLADGSLVELGKDTEVRVDRPGDGGDGNGDGIQIDLNRGAVIVTAARQRKGHLRVRTQDLTASVVGTVFSVRIEPSGSRVFVLEGKVEVRQGTQTSLLIPGQQISAGSFMPVVSLPTEFEWSRNPVTLASLAALTPAALPQQPIPPASVTGLGSIEGMVVRQGTNEPIAGAELELSRVEGTSDAPLGPGVADMFNSILFSTSYGLPAQGAVPPPLLAPEVKYGKTGGDGKFAFRDLKQGKYRLVAIRSGGLYYPVEYGQRDLMQRGLNLPVAAGEVKRDVKIEMVPTGAISGRVTDEDGQPMGHVVVMALTPQERAGEVHLEIERVVLTDERGEYRIFWLGPGKYSVAAVYEDPQRRTIETAPSAPPGRTIGRQRATSPVLIRQLSADGGLIEEAYGVVYAGGSTDPRAARMIDVQSAETFAGVDIPLGAGRMKTNHIRGVVIDGDNGQPVGNVRVLAIPRQWRPNALVLEATSKSDGSFDLPGAFIDIYVLTATNVPFEQGPNVTTRSTPRAGYVVLEVGSADVSNVRLVMRGGANIVGRVTIEGRVTSDSDPDLAKMRVSLTRDPDLIAMPQGLLPPPPPPPAIAPAPAPPAPGRDPGQVAGNGDFMLYVSQGDFRVNVSGVPANTYLKSMRRGGEDLLRSGLHVTGPSENPLQITIGTDGGTVSGTILDQTSRPFTNATVVLVPDAPYRTYSELYRNTTSDSDGNFRLTAIAPGNYKVFAWEWASTDSWQNADFIRGYEGSGKNVQVSPSGRHEKIQLNVILTKARR